MAQRLALNGQAERSTGRLVLPINQNWRFSPHAVDGFQAHELAVLTIGCVTFLGRWTNVREPSNRAQQALSRRWWNLLQSLVIVAVEKWKAFCVFQAQHLFHGHQAAVGCRHLMSGS
ncbi:MAG TPA: hypothetical protein VEH30_12935 [Terriglobales bacterium]|nr:hypothetical protein [Terriglobales bacterium]